MAFQIDRELLPVGLQEAAAGVASLFLMKVIGDAGLHDMVGPIVADKLGPIGPGVESANAVEQALAEAGPCRHGHGRDLGLKRLTHAATRLTAASTSCGVRVFMQA